MPFSTVIRPQVILQKKERNRLRNFFQSEDAIWSILLKFQEIDVQIQKHSLRKIETSYIVAFLNGTNCQSVEYKY